MTAENFIRSLPENFRQNTTEIFGAKGRKWLSKLPRIVEEISEKHSLKTSGGHFADLSFNYVLPCVFADGRQAVLKIGFPENKSSVLREHNVLEVFGGDGICKTFGFDEEFNALFVERLIPGEDLKEICAADDRKSNEIAVGIMRKLWREPPETGNIISLDDWLESFTKTENFEFENEIFTTGRDIYRQLLVQTRQKILLHGDLHHENILSAEREKFLAIDPKGIVGDIGYEISVFLNNPRTWILEHSDSQKVLKDRISQFSEAFETEPEILYKWAFALPILAAFWSHQDNSADWKNWLALAKIWENTNI